MKCVGYNEARQRRMVELYEVWKKNKTYRGTALGAPGEDRAPAVKREDVERAVSKRPSKKIKRRVVESSDSEDDYKETTHRFESGSGRRRSGRLRNRPEKRGRS